jgi:hypothetical protein
MLPTDEHGLRCSRELIRKASEFVTNCKNLFKPIPLWNLETGQVDSSVTYRLFDALEKQTHGNDKASKRWDKLQDDWENLLEDHYSAFSYRSIPPLCREWIWSTHSKVLFFALGLGLVLERLAVEKMPGMGTTVTPRAHEVLGAEVALFASDAQLYGVEQRAVLQERAAQLREVAMAQARPFLHKQFEF